VNDNGGQVFVPITNKDVYLKLLDMEKEVARVRSELDALRVRLYTVVGVLSAIGAMSGFIGVLLGK
jgi:hypothetical protein